MAGTRAAMFAPVCHLGLVVLWDDGDDLHAEPRAPYPNAREVLALRAHRSGAAALIGGFSRTVELTQLVEAGWAQPLAGRQETLRQVAPRVRAAPDEAELARDAAAMTARLPSLALRTARGALARAARPAPRRRAASPQQRARTSDRRARPSRAESAPPGRRAGPRPGAPARLPGRDRLRPVPRPGPLRGLRRAAADRRLGRGARLPLVRRAGGRLDLPAVRIRPPARAGHRCGPHRGGTGPRVPRSAGAHLRRTARAGHRARLARAGHRHPRGRAGRPRGYAAALLLDGWALLGRPSLRAAEETLRRWLNAAALVRPAGPVVVLAEAALPAVQALIRWDPVHFAERELAERAELGFPPAVRMAAISGTSARGRGVRWLGRAPGRAEVLGPVPVEPAAARAMPTPRSGR